MDILVDRYGIKVVFEENRLNVVKIFCLFVFFAVQKQSLMQCAVYFNLGNKINYPKAGLLN